MIEQKKMAPAGLEKWRYHRDNVPAKKEKPPLTLLIPDDLKKALSANTMAAENFKKFAPSYQRNYLGWIAAAKKPVTRAKRIAETVELAEKNIKSIMK